MWMRNDAFHFVWKKVSGDFFLSAKISFPHPGQNPHRKAVLILRQGLDSDAVYADVALHGSGLTALQYRGAKGDVTGDIELNFTGLADAPGTLGIEKRGDYLSMYVSLHGEPLHPSGASTIIHLDGEYYIGLGVCSHNKDVSETAVFSDVKLEPMTGLTVEKPDFLSTLQTISVDSSARRATEVYTAAGQFEAPNWTRDGKSLIFDRGGKIMSIPAAGVDPLTTQPTQIDTGSAINCNGSHGLSPDGKWLAISCSPPGGWASQVYIVPASGGTPRLVTQTPYSFFHSWSPDGKTIAFTRPHEGGGDIFSISVDGGKETRLTTSTGISDDPDYSPDGRYIYFNSDRAGGSMQIWRMHADGSNPEQITNDERNNWTPHLSPDGRSFVFLSYEKNVTGHPANKEISLRLMNLGDRQIRTLVNLVGGTGTINVPSWAPDGKSLAFVSYELVNPSPK
jgi:Tol biopolymer transport system component